MLLSILCRVQDQIEIRANRTVRIATQSSILYNWRGIFRISLAGNLDEEYHNWSCNYKLPEFSLNINLILAYHTICYSLVLVNKLVSLACANISPVSKLLNSPKIL